MAPEKQVPIFIDNTQYMVTDGAVASGKRLRGLPSPNIGPEFDLWLDVEGTENDRKIGLEDQVTLVANMHFYTAPSDLNPGA